MAPPTTSSPSCIALFGTLRQHQASRVGRARAKEREARRMQVNFPQVSNSPACRGRLPMTHGLGSVTASDLPEPAGYASEQAARLARRVPLTAVGLVHAMKSGIAQARGRQLA